MNHPNYIKEWLIRAMNRQAVHDNPYQYAYMFMIHDRKVIVTANGYTAHYSWEIPDISGTIVYEQAGVQVVNFGFGQNLDLATGWNTVVSAFTNLLDRFTQCHPIYIGASRFMDAVEDIHLGCKHDYDSGAAIKLTYRPHRLQIECLQESTSSFELPTDTSNTIGEFNLVIQSGYLKDALFGFEDDAKVTCRFVLNPDILAIGNEGDKVAIIMGIRLDSNEQ